MRHTLRSPFPASPPSGVRGHSHRSHHSHCSHPIPARAARTPPLPPPLCPCGSHPPEFLRASPSLSEFFIKKYLSHFQLTTKNFQKKLRKNLQDKKKRRTFAPANEAKHSLKTRNNTYIDIMLYSTKRRFKELSET